MRKQLRPHHSIRAASRSTVHARWQRAGVATASELERAQQSDLATTVAMRTATSVPHMILEEVCSENVDDAHPS